MKFLLAGHALVVLVAFYLVIAPYSKVEESFNSQAIHDIFNYGVFDPKVIRESFDHSFFPGPIPRTFVGSLLIAGVAKVIAKLSDSLLGADLVNSEDGTQLALLTLCRAILAMANVAGFTKLAQSLHSVNKSSLESSCFVLLLCTQFHLIYYCSRTLPNFIALPLVLLGISQIVEGNMLGLAFLSFTGTVFRLEVGLLACTICLVSCVLFRQSKFRSDLCFIVGGVILGIVISVPIDSYFWGRLVLPELNSFVFNIVNGKSSEWGTEPYGAYFRKYLWQLFRPPTVLVLMVVGLVRESGAAHRRSLRILSVSGWLYIALMSFQPHKEWRFIVYIVPIFTLPAASGMASILRWRWRPAIVLKAAVVLVCVASMLMSVFMGYASSFNYPGGTALTHVNRMIENTVRKETLPVSVHLDVAPCMSGATLFHNIHKDWVTYDKAETSDAIDEVLSRAQIWISEKRDPGPGWKNILVVDGFTGVAPRKALADTLSLFKSPIQLISVLKHMGSAKDYLKLLVRMEPAIYIHERDGN